MKKLPFKKSSAASIGEERPTQVNRDLYYPYNQNRFEASLYGFEGHFINTYTMKQGLIIDDLEETANTIENYVINSGNAHYFNQLLDDAKNNINDAFLLKKKFKEAGTLPKVVAEQCKLWSEKMKQILVASNQDTR